MKPSAAHRSARLFIWSFAPHHSWMRTIAGHRPSGFGSARYSAMPSLIVRPMSGPKGARGRRFEGALDPIAAALNASVEFDRRLLPHDVAGSIAHAEMLAAQGVISQADVTAIVDGLRRVEQQLTAGELTWDEALEDVHMNVE